MPPPPGVGYGSAMRIVLLYPPPWKLSAPAELGDESARLSPELGGPPADYREGDLDPDFWQTPYGLYSLAAQATRAGHQVKLLNLSAYPWQDVERVVSALEADLWGMSCWTANRRGIGYTAELIKRIHPETHIIVGGPHATPLAREMLEYHPAIDTVSEGESELQFLELCARLGRGEPTTGIAGTWFRNGATIEEAPHRASIENLDTLATPHALFDTHIFMTSRGCPWACTFCGAETSWGRGFRAQSVEYVLDALEQAVGRLPVKLLQIKDDTFTTNKKRVLELCRGIRARGLQFLWSCDTRVDVLSDELLREMRLAGCQRLSLGVESGSASILKQIDKKITVDKIVESANLAKKYGIQVRFYMMLGNRGETTETFQETLEFLERARPHQYIFSCLSIYPGTRDFQDAEKTWLDRRRYFEETFQELKVPFDADAETTRVLSEWFAQNCGLRDFYREGVAECKAILAELGDHHAAHMDLAGAYYRERQFKLAEEHIQKALELGYPLPGLAYNYLACMAADRRDLQSLQEHLRTAIRTDPQHFVVAQNAEALRVWLKQGGPVQNLPLHLSARHDFQIFERTKQPMLPGPLPEDFAHWPPPSEPDPEDPLRSASEPSQSSDQDRTRLKVVSSP